MPNGERGLRCETHFVLNQTFSAPVHIYYEIEGYYQNNGLYSKSRVWEQLRGEENPSVI